MEPTQLRQERAQGVGMIGQELHAAIPSFTDAQLEDLLALALAAYRGYRTQDELDLESEAGIEQLCQSCLNELQRRRASDR